jgi:hypothetical protein
MSNKATKMKWPGLNLAILVLLITSLAMITVSTVIYMVVPLDKIPPMWSPSEMPSATLAPTAISTLTPISTKKPSPSLVGITLGYDHSCALHANGTVWCWGSNRYGQLGNGTTTQIARPVQVLKLDDVASIDAGDDHTCAMRFDGTVWCWGYNGYGEVSIQPALERLVPSPVAVTNLSNVRAISVGDYATCALRSDTTVWCWGSNHDGELGDAFASEERSTPGQVPGLIGIEALSMGSGSVCAVGSKHTAWCWGWNAYGQLGDGTTQAQLTPVAVSNLTDIRVISQGSGQHTCAVRSDGTVWCWGSNYEGQLGDGTKTDRSTPQQVPDLNNVTDISVGWGRACIIRSDSTVWCWGGGQIMPSQVRQLKNAASISVGAHQSCALLSDSTIWCWGKDLGLPVQVAGLP